MDFSIKQYKSLISTLVESNYNFQTFEEYLESPKKKSIVLRHDVDSLPLNSLQFAKIQKEFGIKGTYYFRAVPESWDEKIILEIHSLGHEIGFHYETMDTANSSLKKRKKKFTHDELLDLAFEEFCTHLEALRELVPVKTICMHGSPLSKYDNKEIWTKFDYNKLGIIGEPYFDIDFSHVFYLTDTGRRWDGVKVSIRDKVKTEYKNKFHTTREIILAANNNQLPEQIMITFHPQRWREEKIDWLNELISQNIKNLIKKYFIVNNQKYKNS